MLHRLINSFIKKQVLKRATSHNLSLENISKESFSSLMWYEYKILALDLKTTLAALSLVGFSTALATISKV